MGSHKVVGKAYVFTKNSQMASIGAIFTSTYQTKQLNLPPNSSAIRVVNYSCCLLIKGIWSHLKVTRALVDVRQASETRHNKTSLGNFQHHYLAKMLYNS